MEDAFFMEGFVGTVNRRRRKVFQFLLEIVRHLISEDRRIDQSVRNRFEYATENLKPDEIQNVSEEVQQVARDIRLKNDACKEENFRAVKAMKMEPAYPLLEIDDCVAFHARHIKEADPQSYCKFFACIGSYCTEVAAWGMDSYILKIIKEAESVAYQSAAHSYPVYDEMCKYFGNDSEDSGTCEG